MYLGTALIVLGLGKIHAEFIGRYDFTGSVRFAWSLAYIGVLCVVAYGIGLPDLPRTDRSAIASSLAAAAGGAVGISLLQLFTGDALLPRFVVFGAALSLTAWYILTVEVATGGRTRDEERDRALFVGGRDAAELLARDIVLSPERPVLLVRTMAVDEAQSASPRSRPLLEGVMAERASVVILDRDAQANENVVGQAAKLHEEGIRIRTLSLFYEEWLGKLPVSELERVSMLFDIGEVHRARYGRIKRLFDLVLAASGAVVMIVLLPFIVIGDAFANRGSLFYRQERIGKNGEPFNIYKFRTMRPGPPAVMGAGEWTKERDPRITPFGALLRRTHLDELPQVVNILKGDLSVVGPRPEQPHYVHELVQKLPFYGLRHLVRPGLTGWAQVKYGYAGDEADALEKLQYEFFYLRRQGVLFDIRIIGRTVRSILGSEGGGR
jgi:lipopolysaccharide/colanic/teichoic acid biosynthesis glycosyltransferase